MKVFVCKDDFENILSGIYDAWEWKLKGEDVQLQILGAYNYEFFCEYIEVATDWDKAEKVIRSVKKKIGNDAYECLFKTYLNCSADKADVMYRFLISAFKYGRKTMECLYDEAIMKAFSYARAVGNESHLYTGFTRFQERKDHILLAKFKPKHNVISIIAPHFADRLPMENWIIFDEERKLAAIHGKNSEWYLYHAENDTWLNQLESDVEEVGYEDLWQVFFETIAIKERTNKKLQQQMLPKHFRTYMNEFKTKQ